MLYKSTLSLSYPPVIQLANLRLVARVQGLTRTPRSILRYTESTRNWLTRDVLMDSTVNNSYVYCISFHGMMDSGQITNIVADTSTQISF